MMSLLLTRYPWSLTQCSSTLHQLPTRPVLLISGDKFQLPPLTTDKKRTTNGINIYQLQGLTRMSQNLFSPLNIGALTTNIRKY